MVKYLAKRLNEKIEHLRPRHPIALRSRASCVLEFFGDWLILINGFHLHVQKYTNTSTFIQMKLIIQTATINICLTWKLVMNEYYYYCSVLLPIYMYVLEPSSIWSII